MSVSMSVCGGGPPDGKDHYSDPRIDTGKQDQGVWCPGSSVSRSSVSASVDPLSVRLALGRTSGFQAAARRPEGGH